MGMYSWECLRCKRSACSDLSHPPGQDWLAQVVVVFPDGDRLSGEYNGYGHVDGYSLLDAEHMKKGFGLYHKVCWNLAGNPGFTVKSPNARDQGHFFENWDDYVVQDVENPPILDRTPKHGLIPDKPQEPGKPE